MTFKLVEGGSVLSLPWTELPTMDETPFVSTDDDDVTEGMNVMAPWYDDSITIQHAQAVIVGQGVSLPLPCHAMHVLADK